MVEVCSFKIEDLADNLVKLCQSRLRTIHPTKFEHGRVSLTKVSFLQFLTYRLLPRLKRFARGWSRTRCIQITKFASIYTFKNVTNAKKWKIKILIFEKCIFFEIMKRGGQKPKISYFLFFSLNLDSFWPRNEFIGHFDEIYYKTWWKIKSPLFLRHTVLTQVPSLIHRWWNWKPEAAL